MFAGDAPQSAIDPPQDRNNRQYDEHSYNWGFEHDVPLPRSGTLILVRRADQQLRQLGDVRRDPSRLIFREQLSSRSATGLIGDGFKK
jgi:hypothetical protein